MFGEIIIVRPASFAFLTAVATCMAFCVLLFFVFGSYTKRTTVDGVVIPDAGLVKIYPQQQGLVLRKHVLEGPYIARGQVLYTISTSLGLVSPTQFIQDWLTVQREKHTAA